MLALEEVQQNGSQAGIVTCADSGVVGDEEGCAQLGGVSLERRSSG
jgi:hypothetical protein